MSAASDFDRMILEFINDDPMTATYLRYIEEYDYATSENVLVEIATPVSGILLDFDRTSNGLSSKFGEMVLAGDKDFYMLPTQKRDPLATPIVPNTTSDKISVAGITYKCHVVKSSDPTGSSPLLYNFMLRR
jgi:hypothetical protein